jgi:hypothetical protein
MACFKERKFNFSEDQLKQFFSQKTISGKNAQKKLKMLFLKYPWASFARSKIHVPLFTLEIIVYLTVSSILTKGETNCRTSISGCSC